MADGWEDDVAFAGGQDGFAYIRGQVLGRGPADEVVGRAREVSGAEQIGPEGEFGGYTRLVNVPDPVALIGLLREIRVEAQLNHVLFADGCGCCTCPAHPALAMADPVYASPVYASPVYASPVYASPVYASPVYASLYQRTGLRPSSARPCPEIAEIKHRLTRPTPAHGLQIAVLDTGLADEGFRPNFLRPTIVGLQTDEPDEVPGGAPDGELDPAAGHGTFIAGLIDQITPGCSIQIHRVLTTLGAGDEWEIRQVMHEAVDNGAQILNLSFSGHAFENAHYLAAGVGYAQSRGAVVVASAGNSSTCRPTIPGCLPGVIAVGAIGPTGPAPFTNYGPWVRACAPGVDLVSTFFRNFDGLAHPAMGGDPDKFDDWAVWSGTSFAAPIVVAALARSMVLGESATPGDAVARVIDAPWLMRLPGLGTVVNIV